MHKGLAVTTAIGEAEFWPAVLRRDRSADGTFVYAVSSTGIYCAPSCPSRKPRLDRVRFFPTAAAARAAGYRACLRCRPDRNIGDQDASATRLIQMCRAIGAEPSRRWRPKDLAKIAGCSEVQVRRIFKTALGLPPSAYAAFARRREFLSVVRSGGNVTDAVYRAGYGAPSRVYGSEILPGMTPATYRKGGAGATIEWVITPSPIGRILVAATARGLCFVEVAQDDLSLIEELKREFPAARISDAPSSSLEGWADAARKAADGLPSTQKLPVDVRGTAFQWRVWHALTKIPRGETWSYAQLASSLDEPRSVRAVARACATNPLALVVPCHRVVGAKGELRGYRWGLEVKRQLIERERERKA